MAFDPDYPFEMTTVEQSVAEASIEDVMAGTIKEEGIPRGRAHEKELERLYTVSPTYAERSEHWRFLAQAYEGGPAYISEKTLFKHEREHEDSYKDRLARAHYWNYCTSLNDFVPDFIFRDPAERSADESIKNEFNAFVLDVDRMGTTLPQFMRRVSEEARLYGLIWIACDKPAIPAGTPATTMSLQQAREQNLDKPYWYIVRRPEVLDFDVDQFGSYTYLKRLVSRRERKGNDWVLLDRVIEWTQLDVLTTTIDVTDPKKKRIVKRERLNHTWHKVPFVPVFNRRSKFMYDEGVSFLEDIAYQNREVFNLTSLLGEFLARQCFNVLVMEQDTAIPTRSTTAGEIGTANVLEIPKGVQNPPAYLSPPVDPAQFVQSEREAVVREMYRQAVQDVANEIFGGTSGEAQNQALGRAVPNIARLADELQLAETKSLTLWAEMSNREWKGKISYRRDYSISTLMDMVLQLSGILNNLKILPPRFIREQWLRVIREFDGRLDPDAMTEIENQIKALSDEELVDRYMPPEPPASEMMPTSANLMQGKTQEAYGTDKGRSLATGDRSATKEGARDAQRRTSQSTVREPDRKNRS